MQEQESQKQNFLCLIKNCPNITLEELFLFLNYHEGLCKEDFKGYVSDNLYEELMSHQKPIDRNILKDKKCSDDIFKVVAIQKKYSDSPLITEIDALYNKLCHHELERMKHNPGDYKKDEIEQFIKAGIFTVSQLINEGLTTMESWEKLQMDRNLFPCLKDYQTRGTDLRHTEGSVDIFLFGTPGTGKTSLLMGLVGADGNGYTLDYNTASGRSAAALREYVSVGIFPNSSSSPFCTVIQGTAHFGMEPTTFNMVELPTYEFVHHIANNQEVSFDDMGIGANILLRNRNRKIFLIIVDPCMKYMRFNPIDTDHGIIENREHSLYISQSIILDKYISLFSHPENQGLMRYVDAIHIIVTKTDILGEGYSRMKNAHAHILNNYREFEWNLTSYCRRNNINVGSNNRPQVFGFSLGKFYLGGVFDFYKYGIYSIIETMIYSASGYKSNSARFRATSTKGAIRLPQGISLSPYNHQREDKDCNTTTAINSDGTIGHRSHSRPTSGSSYNHQREDSKRTTIPESGQDHTYLPKSNRKGFWKRIFGRKRYHTIYGSAFAPAETKRGSRMMVQVFLHLHKETKKVIELAKETDKNAKRHYYISLQTKLQMGDVVDMERNVYG